MSTQSQGNEQSITHIGVIGAGAIGQAMAKQLVRAGVSGAIIPDLPLEESGDWEAEATAAGVETVLLAAPITPDERLARICERSRGFVYAVGLMGVTGERATLASSNPPPAANSSELLYP